MLASKVNRRKEFFRIRLSEIRKAVAKHHRVLTFVLDAEAKDYRKTLSTELNGEQRSRPGGVGRARTLLARW
jgi:hypothetical protein